MRLLAQHALNSFGRKGAGLAIEIARDGRRILWRPHERAPRGVCQTERPQPHMRSDPPLVPDAGVRDNGEDWAKLIAIPDPRDETNPVPPLRDFAGRGGRFGADETLEMES